MVEDAAGLEYGHAADCGRRLAAAGVHNAEDLVRDWIRRGKISKVTDFDGRPVYRMADVFRVELATRRTGKRGRLLTKRVSIPQH